MTYKDDRLIWDMGVCRREIDRKGFATFGEKAAYAAQRAIDVAAERWTTPYPGRHGKAKNHETERKSRIKAWLRLAACDAA